MARRQVRQLKFATYKVTVGFFDGHDETDNWRSKTVLAADAIQAIKKIRLRKGEFISEVMLGDRLS